MTRLLRPSRTLPLLVALALVGCGGALADRSDDDLRALYEEALEAGDGERALDVLTEQADRGDLGARWELAQAYARAYVVARYDPRDPTATHLPIQTWLGPARLAQWRYERARDAAAATGDPTALIEVAEGLLGHTYVPTRPPRTPTQADRDSAAALFAQARREAPASLRLAFLARHLGRDTDYRQVLAEAAAHDPQACMVQMWTAHPRASAEALSASFDTTETCRALPAAGGRERWDHGAHTVRQLAGQMAGGNAHAAALVDSLRALGVFERHPRLTAFLPDA